MEMVVPAFLDETGQASLRCPSCSRSFRVRVPDLEGLRTNFRITAKCTCGKRFLLLFDRRRAPRKRTDLSGGYFHQRHQYRGLITIKNLSKNGAGIELFSERPMFRGDKLTLKFNLDDTGGTYIEKEAIIRRANKSYFGMEFLSHVEDPEPLSTYLNPA